jgi:hypothetical protein
MYDSIENRAIEMSLVAIDDDDDNMRSDTVSTMIQPDHYECMVADTSYVGPQMKANNMDLYHPISIK